MEFLLLRGAEFLLLRGAKMEFLLLRGAEFLLLCGAKWSFYYSVEQIKKIVNYLVVPEKLRIFANGLQMIVPSIRHELPKQLSFGLGFFYGHEPASITRNFVDKRHSLTIAAAIS